MLRSLLNGLVFVVWTTFFSAVGIVLAIVSARRFIPPWARLWGRGALWFCGIRAQVEGAENIDPQASYIVMPNHTSHFDVVSLYARLPVNMRMVAKRELSFIPIFGWALALGASIIIDRGNRERAIASIARAKKALSKGGSIVMFPEGTRTPPFTIGEMKKGPFYLAQETGTPVLPVGVHGTHEILKKGDWQIRPGRVLLRVGKPILVPSGLSPEETREALMQQVRSALGELYGVQSS